MKIRNTASKVADSQGEGARQVASSRYSRFATVADTHTEVVGEQASNTGRIAFGCAVFAASFAVLLAVCWLVLGELTFIPVAVAAVAALIAASVVRVAQQWEKVVVLRMGKYNRVAGPGPFFVIPFVESAAMRVDGRVRVTTFGAEETLTADLVPLYVDAVLFWMVFDAKAACTEVGDFTCAVEMAAQTALRDAIGRGGAAEVALRREQLDRELKERLANKVGDWGVTILSVEVRDIVLPKELQEVMSLEAQAEQRKKARIILMEAEQDISEMMEDVSQTYAENDAALHLRSMHLLYESVRETGGTVVVPSSFSEGFSDIMPDSLKGTIGK
jgi:regulator of protease activity HflC (stomatin/prohibitin superfamily)